MTDINESLRKLAMAGIGAAGEVAEKAGEVIEGLAKKGESLVSQGTAMNEQLKHNLKESIKENVTVFTSTPDLQGVLTALEAFTREERAAVAQKLDALAKDENHANG